LCLITISSTPLAMNVWVHCHIYIYYIILVLYRAYYAYSSTPSVPFSPAREKMLYHITLYAYVHEHLKIHLMSLISFASFIPVFRRIFARLHVSYCLVSDFSLSRSSCSFLTRYGCGPLRRFCFCFSCVSVAPGLIYRSLRTQSSHVLSCQSTTLISFA
jgi:hypothetical protein